ncbi:MAG TPA: hypothetical protein VFU02_02590 [Polyangiaceae bacterium]|nr:hypothetical protein [Polyangiaceae bacterium]
MDSETKDGARRVSIPAGGVELAGEFTRVRAARGLVVLVCASSDKARRSAERSLAEQLHASRISTLRIDLITEEEAAMDLLPAQIGRDADLLAQRLRVVHRWAEKQRASEGLALGYYGSGAAGCAALRLASKQQPGIDALVICEVKSDLDDSRGRDSRVRSAPRSAPTEPDPELLCDLFRNWLWWENNAPMRAPRARVAQDRPSAAP